MSIAWVQVGMIYVTIDGGVLEYKLVWFMLQ